MHRTLRRVLSVILLLAETSYGQSLADVARQNRANKDKGKDAPKATKVITTDDLSPSPPPGPAPVRTPETWARQILWQKRWVSYYQAQADSLGATSDGAQAAKVLEQLAKEKEKLSAMQEAAFEAGMPNSVYNPKTPVHFSNSNGALRHMYLMNAQH